MANICLCFALDAIKKAKFRNLRDRDQFSCDFFGRIVTSETTKIVWLNDHLEKGCTKGHGH